MTFRLLTPENEVEKIVIDNYQKDNTVTVTEDFGQILKRISKADRLFTGKQLQNKTRNIHFQSGMGF